VFQSKWSKRVLVKFSDEERSIVPADGER